MVELLVVMVIISILLSLVTPRYFHSVSKAEEAVLRQNLALTREALDKYHSDTGKYPNSLDDLVTKRYLRKAPYDPVTQSTTTWITVPPADPSQGAIYDIKSGAPGKSNDGTAFADW